MSSVEWWRRSWATGWEAEARRAAGGRIEIASLGCTRSAAPVASAVRIDNERPNGGTPKVAKSEPGSRSDRPAGSLPARAANLVLEWTAARRDELVADWERAARGEAVVPITPLP